MVMPCSRSARSPVRQQRQIDVAVAACRAGLLHRLQLIFENRFRIVQQSPDQGRLAIVHTAGSGKAQQIKHNPL